MRIFETAQLAALLKVRRGARSLREVARESGVSTSMLSRLENGKTPDMETAQRVYAWLQMATTSLKKEQGDVASELHLDPLEHVEVILRGETTIDAEVIEAMMVLLRRMRR